MIVLGAAGVALLAVAVYSAHSSPGTTTSPVGAAASTSPSPPPVSTGAPSAPATGAAAGATASAVAGSPAAPSASPSVTSTVKVNDAAVHVAVFNGCGVTGRAASVKSALVTDGFSLATVGGTLAKTPTTEIYYPQGRSDSAAAVARALSIPSANVTQSTTYTEVTLVVGTDWTTGNTYPAGGSPTSTP